MFKSKDKLTQELFDIMGGVDNHNYARRLIKKGADIHFKRGEAQITHLHAAAQLGDPRIANEIIAAGADVHARDCHGETPLHKAAGFVSSPLGKQLEVAKLLLEYGADINARADDGKTPLFEAINDKSIKTVEFLLANGADPNARTEHLTVLVYNDQVVGRYDRSLADTFRKMLVAAGAVV